MREQPRYLQPVRYLPNLTINLDCDGIAHFRDDVGLALTNDPARSASRISLCCRSTRARNPSSAPLPAAKSSQLVLHRCTTSPCENTTVSITGLSNPRCSVCTS